MTTGAERRRRPFGFLLAVCAAFAAASACRTPERRPPAGGGELGAACASACAALVGAGCFGEHAAITSQRTCVEACTAHGSTSAKAGCDRELVRFLGCLGQRPAPSCGRGELSPRLWLEHAGRLDDCAPSRDAHLACTRPCREAGVVRTAALPEGGALGSSVQAELVGLGCNDDVPLPSPRAPAGSACTHHSVCTAVRCECPLGGAYLARACVRGRCADRARACEVAPRAVGHDPCGRKGAHAGDGG